MVSLGIALFKSFAAAMITAACVGTADSGPPVSSLEAQVQTAVSWVEQGTPANYAPPLLPVGPLNHYLPRSAIDIEPTYLRIPIIGLEEPVGRANVEKGHWATPEKGVVTMPYDSAFRDPYRSQIWGHSRWHLLPGSFSNLNKLALGDELIISGDARERLMDGSYTSYGRTDPVPIDDVTYEVSDISIVDGSTVYNNPGVLNCPEISLLTSLKESRPGAQWIFHEQTVRDAHVRVSGPLDDSDRYLYLLITARMTSQSAARVGGQWVCDPKE